MNTMRLPVTLTASEVSVRSQELAAIIEKKAATEYDMKAYAATCKKALAEADEKIRELTKIVLSGKESRHVDVVEYPNYERNLMETIRLDTHEIVEYREMKESEKTRNLFELNRSEPIEAVQ